MLINFFENFFHRKWEDFFGRLKIYGLEQYPYAISLGYLLVFAKKSGCYVKKSQVVTQLLSWVFKLENNFRMKINLIPPLSLLESRQVYRWKQAVLRPGIHEPSLSAPIFYKIVRGSHFKTVVTEPVYQRTIYERSKCWLVIYHLNNQDDSGLSLTSGRPNFVTAVWNFLSWYS